MAQDIIGEPTLKLKADATGLKADLSAAAAAVGAAMSKAEKAAAKETRAIQAAINRINAVGPTKQIGILSKAIEQVGGVSKLSSDQVRRLTADVERLAAAGAKVPKNLAGLGGGGVGAASGAVRGALQSSLLAAGPGGAVGAGLTALGPAGIAAAAGIGAVTVGFGLAAKAANDFLERASQLSDLSAKTGLGTEFLQRLDAAGAAVGVSLEESAGAVFKLEKQIGAAALGSKEAAQSFKDIGVSLDDLKGKKPEEQFKIVATALSTITDQERFVAAGTEVMGKGFANVAALIRSDFVGAMDAAVVISEEQIAKADEIGDAFTRMGKASETLKLELGAAFLGVLSGGADAASAIDTATAAIVGLSKIVKDPEFQTALRLVLAVATLGVSEGAINVVKGLAAKGGPEADEAKAAASRDRAIATAQQEVQTRLAQASASTRQARKEEADAQKKAAAEAERFRKELERVAEEERRGAIEANKRWTQEQADIEKVNAAIRKHISDLQVGVFGTSKQAATEAAHEFDLLQAAITRAGESIETMSEGELKRLETQLVKLEQLTRADAKANDEVATSLGKVREQLRNIGAEGQLEGVKARTDEIKKSTFAWSGFLQGIVLLAGTINDKFSSVVGVIGNIRDAFNQAKTGAEKFAAVAAGIGQIGGIIGGRAGNAISGAAGGALTGFALGGPVGAAIGGVAGGLLGLFKSDPIKKAQKEIGKVLGTGVTREMAEQILASSKQLGISIREAAKRFKAEQDAIIEQTRRENVRAGIDRATEGANQLAAGLESSTPAVARSAADIFSAAFWAKVKKDGPAAAAEAFGPAFDQLTKDLKAKGIDTAFLGPIAQQIGLGRDKKFAAAGTVATGAANVLGGLRQAGLVDTQLLAATGKLAGDLFTQAQEAAGAAGLGPQEAARAGFQAIASLLQEQLNASLASGQALDANTQKLIDEAKANGIEILADPAIQSVAIQKDQLSVLRRIDAGIGGIGPAVPEGAIPAAAGVLGFTGGTSPLIQAHPHEFVAVIPAATLSAMTRSAEAAVKRMGRGGAGASMTFAPQFTTPITVEVSGSADGQNIADQVAEQVAQENQRLTAELRRQWERFNEDQ